MCQTLPNRRIVLASNNPGKLRELQQLLSGQNRQLLSQSDLGIPEVAETGLSFVENALIKARHVAQHSGLPAIADDSGIEVAALNGAPGIYSARYAGADATDAANVQKLLIALHGVPDNARQARFQCLMVYLRHAEDPTPLICQGTWIGRIMHAPQGENGFGYAPVFFVPSHHCSAAQLDPVTKNQLSHRGQALRALLTALELRLTN